MNGIYNVCCYFLWYCFVHGCSAETWKATCEAGSIYHWLPCVTKGVRCRYMPYLLQGCWHACGSCCRCLCEDGGCLACKWDCKCGRPFGKKKKKKVIKPTFRIPNQVRKLNSRLTHVMSPVFLVIKLPRLHPCFHLTFDNFFLQHFSLRTLTGPKRYWKGTGVLNSACFQLQSVDYWILKSFIHCSVARDWECQTKNIIIKLSFEYFDMTNYFEYVKN